MHVSDEQTAEVLDHGRKLGTILRRCFAAWVVTSTVVTNIPGPGGHAQAAEEMDNFLSGDSEKQADE